MIADDSRLPHADNVDTQVMARGRARRAQLGTARPRTQSGINLPPVFAVADVGAMMTTVGDLLQQVGVEHRLVSRVSVSHVSFCTTTARVAIVAGIDPLALLIPLLGLTCELPVLAISMGVPKRWADGLRDAGVRISRRLPISPLTLRRDLRRLAESLEPRDRGAGVWLDTARLEAGVGDVRVQLTRHEFSILQALCARPQEPIPSHRLLLHTWGETGEERRSQTLVAVHVHNLRAKLAAIGLDGAVVTVRNAGYAFQPSRRIQESSNTGSTKHRTRAEST